MSRNFSVGGAHLKLSTELSLSSVRGKMLHECRLKQKEKRSHSTISLGRKSLSANKSTRLVMTATGQSRHIKGTRNTQNIRMQHKLSARKKQSDKMFTPMKEPLKILTNRNLNKMVEQLRLKTTTLINSCDIPEARQIVSITTTYQNIISGLAQQLSLTKDNLYLRSAQSKKIGSLAKQKESQEQQNKSQEQQYQSQQQRNDSLARYPTEMLSKKRIKLTLDLDTVKEQGISDYQDEFMSHYSAMSESWKRDIALQRKY